MRTSAQVHSEKFKDCVGLMAEYIYDRFGKSPGTVRERLLPHVS